MRIFVTGATGLLGTRVVQSLLDTQHEVTIVTRSAAHAHEHFNNILIDIVEADITTHGDWQTIASECDAIVHLAGAGIVDRRWTKSYKNILEKSRIDSTRNIAQVASKILVCASATGFYGDRGRQKLTEVDSVGEGFLAELCKNWEQEAAKAAGRVVCLRFGMVLDSRGGAFAKMRRIFMYGLGGSVGSGKQYWPWISWKDACCLIQNAINQQWEGAINAVAPEQVTCTEFVQTLGRILKRPSIAKMPRFILKTVLGESHSVLTGSQRVAPALLMQKDFEFEHPNLVDAIEFISEEQKSNA
jgi:uncharacterized protein (TIGR01777 family)